MASTWGNNTWGSNEWQDDVITAVVSGQAATSQLGDPLSFNETGWGRITWGTADWGEGADETVSVTGLEATASPGSITIGIGVLLEMIGSNHSMTTDVGSVDIDAELGVPVTGVSSTFATPTLSYTGTLVGWGRDDWGDLSWGESPNQVIGLVGQDATASVGSISPADSVGLSGQESTTSVGSTTIRLDSTPSITGQESTISQGSIGLEFGPASISGVAATSGVGSLGLEFGADTKPVTGVAATSAVGSLEIGSVELVDVTGVAATTAVGSVVLEITVPLTGIAATSAAGSFASIADITQGLSLDEITASPGIIGIQAYGNVDTGSNTSYSNVSTGSNDTYSDVATGSNTSYTDAA